MTPGQLSSAISHVERALQSVEARLEELRVGPQQRSAPPSSTSDSKGKGKGKGVASSLLKGDSVHDLSPEEIEAELKEMDELRSDLMLKVRDFRQFSCQSLTFSCADRRAEDGTRRGYRRLCPRACSQGT